MAKAKTISKILKLKENRKREIEIEVKKASERVDEEKLKLINLEKEYNEKLRFFNKRNEEGSLTVNNVALYHNFFSRISSRIKEQKEVHMQHKNELKLLRKNLVNAHKDKRVFEILENRIIKKDLREKEVSEQKDADFFTIARKMK